MSVVAAKGFAANGIAAGIKPDGRDLAVLLADAPAVTSAVFTGNLAAAVAFVRSLRGDQNATWDPTPRESVKLSG